MLKNIRRFSTKAQFEFSLHDLIPKDEFVVYKDPQDVKSLNVLDFLKLNSEESQK